MEAPTRTGVAAATGDGGLSALLSTEFLISASGNKVNPKDIEGKTIGLYFAANWFQRCVSFTPLLVSVYHKLMEQELPFEIVFVSSDENQSSFEQFYSSMPWPAVPFGDVNSKRSLSHKFQIEGIPALIILEPGGGLIQTEGVEILHRHGLQAFPFTSERIAELEAEEKRKYASQTLEKLLAISGKDHMIKHNDQVTFSSLVGTTVGLYFAAQWCPPCLKFSSRLISVYNHLQERREEFEVVFVSMDRDEAGFSRYFSGMPWFALPYDEESSKALARYFDIQEIPMLVIIGPDGKTVTKEGRNLINLHMEMAYPFTEARIRLLQEKMDEEAKQYPSSFKHEGHRHVLNLVSEKSGGGPFICCACDEQGLGWAYQCLACGYEIHLKCGREVKTQETDRQADADGSSCSLGAGRQ
ncbi:AhpC/TSA family [Musa troglodytarum]|uniref:protein-disulfide reductase n=1 Tax=Musa troglodytarum TaxID=320322 RepID=A0A9E7H3L0_9LILI|nr:AhpC/TSA family [Musa troglodytarum]